MSRYSLTLRNRAYTFADLREVMGKASPLRSGDRLAGLAAEDTREQVAAQTVLADRPAAAGFSKSR